MLYSLCSRHAAGPHVDPLPGDEREVFAGEAQDERARGKVAAAQHPVDLRGARRRPPSWKDRPRRRCHPAAPPEVGAPPGSSPAARARTRRSYRADALEVLAEALVLLTGVVRGADHRACLAVQEALPQGLLAKLRELVGAPVLLHRDVGAAGLEVLPEVHDVGAGGAQVIEGFEDLVPALAEPQHDAGLHDRRRVELPRGLQETQRPVVAGP